MDLFILPPPSYSHNSVIIRTRQKYDLIVVRAEGKAPHLPKVPIEPALLDARLKVPHTVARIKHSVEQR